MQFINKLKGIDDIVSGDTEKGFCKTSLQLPDKSPEGITNIKNLAWPKNQRFNTVAAILIQNIARLEYHSHWFYTVKCIKY